MCTRALRIVFTFLLCSVFLYMCVSALSIDLTWIYCFLWKGKVIWVLFLSVKYTDTHTLTRVHTHKYIYIYICITSLMKRDCRLVFVNSSLYDHHHHHHRQLFWIVKIVYFSFFIWWKVFNVECSFIVYCIVYLCIIIIIDLIISFHWLCSWL